jgi:hypothetical protein
MVASGGRATARPSRKDDPDRGPHRLHGAGHAGEQPAAADRDQDRADLGELVEQLAADGSLPGDHVGVVERVDEGGALLGDVPLRRRQRLGEGAPDELHPGAERLGGGDLDRGRAGGHVDHGGNPEVRGGEGDALRVVAGAGGHHPAAPDRGWQPRYVHERPAELERAGPLQQLALQVHRRAARRGAGEHRGLDGDAAELLGRLPDVLDAHDRGVCRDGWRADRAGQGGCAHELALSKKKPLVPGTEG